MGNNLSFSKLSIKASVQTKEGKLFSISYSSLVDHILLLRKVIAHPEMTQRGYLINDAINYYCQSMVKREMNTEYGQQSLPWQVEWIWHVHRLHPLAYRSDCMKQLPDGMIINKRSENLGGLYVELADVSKLLIKNYFPFVPSIDLTEAVLRQRDFLDKFKQHVFFSKDLNKTSIFLFRQMIQNYVSFVKLAQSGKKIVPTFDIDLIWHTHMRYPLAYHTASIDLCGYILDHNDSIPKNILENAYKETASRWALAYQSEYGGNPNRNHLKNTQYLNSCAMVIGASDNLNKKDQSYGGCCTGYQSCESSSSCSSDCGGCGD